MAPKGDVLRHYPGSLMGVPVVVCDSMPEGTIVTMKMRRIASVKIGTECGCLFCPATGELLFQCDSHGEV